jgi:Protein of unknown function (DUF3631)
MMKRDRDNPEHTREQFRARNPHVQRLPALRQQIASAVQQRLPDLRSWRPENDFLKGNRNADNWEPLVAIADLAGGDWPKIARKAAEDAANELQAWEGAEETDSDWLTGPRLWPSRALRSIGEVKLTAKKRIVDHLPQVAQPLGSPRCRVLSQHQGVHLGSGSQGIGSRAPNHKAALQRTRAPG